MRAGASRHPAAHWFHAACFVLPACFLALVSLPLRAAPVAPTAKAPRPVTLPYATVQSVFHIEKSENRNQVHYAVRVDAACRPTGTAPLYGYWRELEKGPMVVSALLSHEQPAYGLTPARSIRQLASGGEIRISLRGFPERPLRIETARVGTACGARAITEIQRQPAMLNAIYVKIGFLFSVEYAITRGLRLADAGKIEEKIHE